MSDQFATLEKRSDDAITAVVGYFVLAATTIHLTSIGNMHAAMWPADALILAQILRSPRNSWPLTLAAGWVGNFLANALTRDWTPGLILYGGINMGQVALAAHLIGRTRTVDELLADMRTVMRFVRNAGVIAPAAGAVLGSLASMLNFGGDFVSGAVRWYFSNALGMLIVTPFALAVLNGNYRQRFRERSRVENIEAIALQLANLLVALAVFGQIRVPILFLPLSSVLVLAFRLGRLGAILGIVVIAVVGTATQYMRLGPMTMMAGHTIEHEFIFQFYLAMMLMTVLPVAATVAARAEALRHLAEREEALRLMMTHSPDGILGFDMAGICRWAEGPLKSYLGLDAETMIGRSMDSLSLKAREASMELLRSGDSRPAVLEIAPVRRPELTLEASIGLSRRHGVPSGTVVTLRDVTKRKAKEFALLSQMQTDELTGLVNRPGFRRYMHAACDDEARQATLALVDIDRFNAINTNHGHAIGDAVLIEISRRLKAATRGDDVVARLSADEFAILLRCDLETARKVCQRMVEEVRATPVYSEGTISVLASISCGLAEYRPGLSRDEVFHAADTALYSVKRSGRNGVRAAA